MSPPTTRHAAPSKTLDLVRAAGRALFLVGLAVFFYALVAGTYTLSSGEIDQLSNDGTIGNATLAEGLRALEGETYPSVMPFISDIEREIETAGESGAPVADWDRTKYKLALAERARNAAPDRQPLLFFLLSFVLGSIGALMDFLPRIRQESAGVKNDGIFHSAMKARGWLGIATGAFLIGFYILLYFFPYYIIGWIRLADPVSQALRNQPADQWFFYGLMYTFCVLVMAVRFAVNYRYSRYQMLRTASISFFQLGFAFLIPAVMVALNKPSYDLKLAWPLDYGFFTDYNIDNLTSSGALGWTILIWGIALALIVVPALAYFFGKRWYCSWVCGCGGLAETLGDPYRQLSDKSVKAWHVERWLVHAVLVFAVVMTGLVLADYFTAQSGEAILGGNSWKVRSWYGFFIGSIFAGVIGTGFYPLMGNRVWCRFGCPLAAILGIVQRFKSRFRITTNGGQCISCGNCSTYCEMGIDVRWYAQRGQNIVRASCVGCGICSQVCPRGVLRLETGPEEGRFAEPSLVQIGQGRVEVG